MASNAERNAQKRAQKLAAQQAALPPEERIINRTDWDEHFSTQVAVSTHRSQQRVQELFVEVTTDPNVAICHTKEEAMAYFKPNGTPFTCEVLRKFVEAAAASKTGRIQETISRITIISELVSLIGVAKHSGNPMLREVKQMTFQYIDGPLLDKQLVHNETMEKQTPMPQDLSEFLRCLFQPQFMNSLQTTRETLLIALFTLLMIDCSARPIELLHPTMSRADQARYAKQHVKKFFTWERVQVYAFRRPHQEGGRVYLQARIKFLDIKNPLHKGSREKSVPLRMLPPHLLMEDTVFWLTILGLIDGVFRTVSSWDDIDRLQPGPNGQLIPIKDNMNNVPVSLLLNS